MDFKAKDLRKLFDETVATQQIFCSHSKECENPTVADGEIKKGSLTFDQRSRVITAGELVQSGLVCPRCNHVECDACLKAQHQCTSAKGGVVYTVLTDANDANSIHSNTRVKVVKIGPKIQEYASSSHASKVIKELERLRNNISAPGVIGLEVQTATAGEDVCQYASALCEFILPAKAMACGDAPMAVVEVVKALSGRPMLIPTQFCSTCKTLITGSVCVKGYLRGDSKCTCPNCLLRMTGTVRGQHTIVWNMPNGKTGALEEALKKATASCALPVLCGMPIGHDLSASDASTALFQLFKPAETDVSMKLADLMHSSNGVLDPATGAVSVSWLEGVIKSRLLYADTEETDELLEKCDYHTCAVSAKQFRDCKRDLKAENPNKRESAADIISKGLGRGALQQSSDNNTRPRFYPVVHFDPNSEALEIIKENLLDADDMASIRKAESMNITTIADLVAVFVAPEGALTIAHSDRGRAVNMACAVSVDGEQPDLSKPLAEWIILQPAVVPLLDEYYRNVKRCPQGLKTDPNLLPELCNDDVSALKEWCRELQAKTDVPLIREELQYHSTVISAAAGCVHQVKTLKKCVKFACDPYNCKDAVRNAKVWREIIVPYFASDFISRDYLAFQNFVLENLIHFHPNH